MKRGFPVILIILALLAATVLSGCSSPDPTTIPTTASPPLTTPAAPAGTGQVQETPAVPTGGTESGEQPGTPPAGGTSPEPTSPAATPAEPAPAAPELNITDHMASMTWYTGDVAGNPNAEIGEFEFWFDTSLPARISYRIEAQGSVPAGYVDVISWSAADTAGEYKTEHYILIDGVHPDVVYSYRVTFHSSDGGQATYTSTISVR